MDFSRQNPLHHFASSSTYPSISSGSSIDLQDRAFPSDSVSSKKQSHRSSFFQSNYGNHCTPRNLSSNSCLGLLNSPLDLSESSHLGFEKFSSLNSSFTSLGKPSTKSFNYKENFRANDDQLVQEYHYLHPSVGLQDCDGVVPFQSPDRHVNQFPASGYSHFVPEKTSVHIDAEGLSICNPNDYGHYHLREHLVVANANNGNTTRKKKKKNMLGQAKGKTKIARESSPSMIKGHWSPEEDRLLLQQVERFGVGRWTKVAKHVKGREGKQCRERWFNYLRPDIKTESWTEEEDQIIIDAYEKMGSKWSVIQNLLTGRTENSIKNHWNTVKRRVENRLAATGRPSSTARKNTRLEKFILSLISSHPTRMPKASRRVNKAAHNDSSEEDEGFDDQQEDQVVQSVAVAEDSYQLHELEVKEDPSNDTFSDYYKVGPPVVQADQHSTQFGNLDTVFMQQLNDFDMSRLIKNQEDSWKAEIEAIKMFLAKDL